MVRIPRDPFATPGKTLHGSRGSPDPLSGDGGDKNKRLCRLWRHKLRLKTRLQETQDPEERTCIQRELDQLKMDLKKELETEDSEDGMDSDPEDGAAVVPVDQKKFQALECKVEVPVLPS